MSHVMNTYARLPIAFERGEGVWLWDAQGKRYMDALAGVAVNAVGHSHPALVAALREQVGKLIHTSNIYQISHQEKLADRLAALSGMDQVFFCNSGAEANEAAIKLARYTTNRAAPPGPTTCVRRTPHGNEPPATGTRRERTTGRRGKAITALNRQSA